MVKRIGVLFDLDGVLLDTEGFYSQLWAHVDECFPTGVPNFAQVIKGSNLEKILNTYFAPEKHADIVAMLHEFQKNMRYDFFEAVPRFLNELKEEGIPMCVVTSSDEAKMQAVYAQHPHFEGFFDAIVVGNMVSRCKPDPECFLMGAERIGCDITDCYVFEDSFSGLQAGMSAGAHVIALATTNSRESLKGKAHKIIDDFAGFTIDDMLSL